MRIRHFRLFRPRESAFLEKTVTFGNYLSPSINIKMLFGTGRSVFSYYQWVCNKVRDGREFFKLKLVSSTLRTCSCKTCLFSYAFRPTIVDFFKEFFKFKLVSSTLRTCSCKTCLFSNAFRLTIELKPWPPNNSHALRKYFTASPVPFSSIRPHLCGPCFSK